MYVYIINYFIIYLFLLILSVFLGHDTDHSPPSSAKFKNE
jgi:hypothetical protein